MITSPLKPKGKAKPKSVKTNHKTLAIDFDQTIHDKLKPISGRKMGPPIDGAYTALNSLKAAGHTIIIHTTMANTPGGAKAVSDWLKWYSIPFDEVVGKHSASFYIDDKALEFKGDWIEVMDKLTKKGITCQ